MGGDLVVALGRAAAHGQTLFGLNCHRPPRECQVLRRVAGRPFAPGETVKTGHAEVPQVRDTFTVLGGQPHHAWGYQYGVNDHQVAAGCASWRSKLAGERLGLSGPEVVRLTLERAANARQALDVLTDLVARHGQAEDDHVFLLADAAEAFTVEAAGDAWAAQEIGEVRAAADVAVIRQDWARLAPGLAERAIARGWWPEDGSKLDFAGAVGGDNPGRAAALRRWGRATYLLEQQSGHIDVAFLRRLLGDHYEGTRYEVDPLAEAGPVPPLCRHAVRTAPAGATVTAASFVAALTADANDLPVAWCAFGPPCLSVYFPVFLDGELPAAFTCGTAAVHGDSLWWRTQQLLGLIEAAPERLDLAHEPLARLQGRFELDVEEFAAEGAALKRRGARDELQRLAGSLMQSHVERFDEVLQGVLAAAGPRAALAETAAGNE
jgi:secernin